MCLAFITLLILNIIFIYIPRMLNYPLNNHQRIGERRQLKDM